MGGISEKNLRLQEFTLTLVGIRTPQICYIPTARGDKDAYIAKFHDTFTTLWALTSEILLFERNTTDLE